MSTLKNFKWYLGLTLLIFSVLLLPPPSAFAQSEAVVAVSGTITSAEDNEPLIGVSIVSDSFQGVTSSIDGTYSINVKAGSVLTFSYLGFQTIEWTVPAGEKQVQHDVAMQSEAESSDDVVVIS